MEFRVLGVLRVTAGGRPVAIGTARKRRTVLAVLLARSGQPVPVDTLAAAVWGGRPPPASARRNLQLYVHQLRQVLGAGRIEATGGGYAIDAGDGLDAARFRRLVAAGIRSQDAGDAAAAGATLRTALDLWYGLAFADFLDCEVVAEEAQRLEQLRLEVYERWAEAVLVTGATGRLISELTELCRRHPYHEGLRGQLMRALQHTGRQAEALAVFRDVRALLVDEVGVEPGEPLRRLHQAILRGEAQLQPPSTAAAVVARELPADPPVFAGRDDTLAVLDKLLPSEGGPAQTVVVSGMGGVGKTALAVHWAHRVADRFPDGQLFVSLRGYGPAAPMRPVEALGLLLHSLGVPAAQIPVELDAAAGMYRSRLAGRRMLLVLDDAREAAQVRPLLPAAGGCLALVTSRDRLAGLAARDGASRLALDVLPPSEAAALVVRLAGDRADLPAAALLAQACGRLPLAIRICAAYLADRPDLDVAGYAETLRHGPRLAGLEVGGDPAASVRSAFAHSYRALAPAARALFRLLGLVPSGDFPVPAAAALAGTDPVRAQRLLDALVQAHLVDPGPPGRFSLHDLLRHYAREQAMAEVREADRATALDRWYAFYLSVTDRAARMLHPSAIRLPVEVQPPGGCRVDLPTEAAAVAWFDAELANLVALTEYAAAAGRHRRMSWLLADALAGHFRLRQRFGTPWLATARAGLSAAAATADRPAMAAAHLNLAAAYRQLGRPGEAAQHATEALAIGRQLGWRELQAAALSSLGMASGELGRNQQALAAFRAALLAHRRTGDRAGAAEALTARSVLRFRMGRLREALRDGIAALEIYQQAPDPAGEAYAHVDTALSYLFLGRFEDALRHATRCRRLFETIGERYGRLLAQCLLSKLYGDAGRYATAREYGTAALDAARQAGHDGYTALALTGLAEIRRAQGGNENAVRDCTEAGQLARRANRPNIEAQALIGLAEAQLHDRQLTQARTSLAAAEQIATRYGLGRLAGLVHTVRGEVALAAADPDRAVEAGQAGLASHRQTGYRLGAARCHLLLSRACADPGARQWHRRAARTILTQVGAPYPGGDAPRVAH